MAKNLDELLKQMSPEDRAESERMAREMMAEMVLVELRKLTGRTQDELAAALGVKQPSLSKLERQDDMHVSTLKRFVEALGGELELIVRLQGMDIRLTQFDGPVSLPEPEPAGSMEVHQEPENG